MLSEINSGIRKIISLQEDYVLGELASVKVVKEFVNSVFKIISPEICNYRSMTHRIIGKTDSDVNIPLEDV